MNQTTLKLALSAILGTAAYWLGGLDQLLAALIVTVILDYITGVLKSIHQKRLSSTVGYQGITKKVGYFVVVALAFVVGELVGNVIPLREVTIVFFIANEGISILENAAELDIPHMDKLKAVLEQLKDKGKGDGGHA